MCGVTEAKKKKEKKSINILAEIKAKTQDRHVILISCLVTLQT